MKKSIVFQFLILMLTFLIQTGHPQTTFTKHVIDNSFGGAGGVYACDFDADGDLDFLGAGNNGGIAWWRNDGGNPLSFKKQVIDANFAGAFSVHAADVDGDHDLDVFGAAWHAHQIACWRNDSGTWTKQIIAGSYTNAHAVYACDLDQDGDVDVLGASAGLNRISWWRNNGGVPISWTEQTLSTNFTGARSVHVADIDNDGDYDVVGAALASNTVAWWQNNGGNPIQWSYIVIDVNFAGAHKIVCYDIDKDGNMDILGAGFANSEISWWRNSGGNPIGWQKQLIDRSMVGALEAYPADLDNDGDIDIVGTANTGDDLAWYANDGSQSIRWTKYMIDANFNGAWPIYTSDFDDDGDVDILAGADASNTVAWWENDFFQFKFTATPTSGLAPLTVQFTNYSHSAKPIIGWDWDFDLDGTIDSHEQHPTWIYLNPGIFSVKLNLTMDDASQSIIYRDFIRVLTDQNAVLFDGEQSCVIAPSANFTDKISVEAWIKPTGWGESGNLGYGRIIDKGKFAFYLIGSSLTYNDHSLCVQIEHSDGSTSFATTPENSVTLDEWQYVAFTYDASLNEVNIYINGAKQTLTQRMMPTGLIADNSSESLFIGNAASRQLTFNGSIDEFRLWEVIRPESGISQNFNQHLSGNEAGLVCYFPMDEGTGDIINDHSGRGNHGMLLDALWSAGVIFNSSDVPEAYVTALPRQVMLFHNYPNPFNLSTSIHFELRSIAEIELAVFNINGKRVKTLLRGIQDGGRHTIVWDGTDSQGIVAGTGVYLCRIVSEGYTETHKMLLVK